MTDLKAPWEKFSAKEWSLALQSLTPGGSEFTEPAECVAYVRRRFETNNPIPVVIRCRRERTELLNACIKARDKYYNSFEPDNQSEFYKELDELIKRMEAR